MPRRKPGFATTAISTRFLTNRASKHFSTNSVSYQTELAHTIVTTLLSVKRRVRMKKTLFKLTAAIALAGMLAGAASAEMVWNRGNSCEPESLDPHKTSAVCEANILRDLFEGLVMSDARGELIPGVAESWTISPDGTVYAFKLRSDAIWSNGDPVTADDFVYALGRLENPETGAEYASMLYVIKNAEAINTGKVKPETIGARGIDAKTLEITLNAPTPYFLEMLTH